MFTDVHEQILIRIESRLARRRITCDLHCRHSVGSNLPMTSISSCRGGSVEVEADRTGMCTKDMYLGRRFFSKSWESRGALPMPTLPRNKVLNFLGGWHWGGALKFPWTKLPGILKATVPFGWRNRRETIPWFRVMSYLPTLCDAKLTCQHILPKPFEVHNGTNIRFDVINEAPILKHTRILHGSRLATHDLNHRITGDQLPPTHWLGDFSKSETTSLPPLWCADRLK